MTNNKVTGFSIYSDWISSNIKMAELFMSSAQVIAQRNALLLRAFTGEIPLHHPEFGRMWQEKFSAGNQSLSAGFKYMKNPAAALPFSLLLLMMAPYQSKVSANIKRLAKGKRNDR